MWIILGLGNPGEEYAKTRHNIGFQCVNELARRHGLGFDTKLAKSRVATGTIAGQRVALAKPFTYMNLIGQAAVGLCQWYKLPADQNLLVIYDDLDLPFGTLRLRERGSAGTHNGMKSVVSLLGSQVFPRIRVGIGQGPPGRDAASYVLGRFTREEAAALPAIIARVADAAESVLREGFTAAMNGYSGAGIT
ncbi:MAG: aminoacyl-tRNA hydrolase [Kouleothrix sp.]|nr:aminoacyl-tRNA hydrolase [Kouleothrix sp.]